VGLNALGIGAGAACRPDYLPFSREDVTLGAECEVQAAVAGVADDVDLALQIRSSNYFANVVKHAATLETPRHAVTAIEAYLSDNTEHLWENSWVRVPLVRLNDLARRVLGEDMRLLVYLVALTSTDHSPALDGTPGHHERTKRDLADLGVFDPRMSFCMPYKPREHQRLGFAGFEGRFYSLFADPEAAAHAAREYSPPCRHRRRWREPCRGLGRTCCISTLTAVPAARATNGCSPTAW
jgi:hypothetical protein